MLALINLLVSVLYVLFIEASVMAFVTGYMLSNLVKNTAYLVYGIKNKLMPIFAFSLSASLDLVRFGIFRIIALGSNYVSSNLDQYCVGFFRTSVGVYNMGTTLIKKPLSTVTPVLSNLALPVFLGFKVKQLSSGLGC